MAEFVNDRHARYCAKINKMIADKGLTGYDKWLAERRCGLGGSDISVILGLNKYKTPYQLWLEKTGRAEPFKGNDATHWGQRLENVIAEEYAERTGMAVHTCPTLNTSKYFWLFGSPDRIVTTHEDHTKPVTILEIKTTKRNVATNEIADDGETVMLWGPGNKYIDGKLAVQDSQVPYEYLLQVHVYMLLTGIKTCDLAVLMQTSDYRVYTIDYDPKLADTIIGESLGWWDNYVLKDKEPSKEVADIKNEEPTEDYGELLPHIRADIVELQLIKQQIAELKEKEEMYKKAICVEIGNRQGLKDSQGNAWATYKMQKGRVSINQELFEIEQPELFKRYRVQGSGFRVLRLKTDFKPKKSK